MNVRAAFSGFWSSVTLQAKPLAEPEPVYGAPKPMRGLFSQLSKEHQKLVLNYQGDENHGDAAFKRQPEHA